MPLSAKDIRAAFAALSDELAITGERSEIVVVGGAALVLLFGARETTKDVDAFFVKPAASVLRAAAERIATRLELPSDWLNDGAKAYLVGLTLGTALYDSEWLKVRAASLNQLLAMKLAAWRDAVDREDAKLLLLQMTGTKESVWASISSFVPPPDTSKAAYAFEDLWESLHGTD